MRYSYIKYVKGLLKDAGLKDKYNVRFGVVMSEEFEERFLNVYYITQFQSGTFWGFPVTTEKPVAVIANLPSLSIVSRLELIRLHSVKKLRVKSDRIDIVPSKIDPPIIYDNVVIDDLAELTTELSRKKSLEVMVTEPSHDGSNSLTGLSKRLGYA
jgi:hypothetical protein